MVNVISPLVSTGGLFIFLLKLRTIVAINIPYTFNNEPPEQT